MSENADEHISYFSQTCLETGLSAFEMLLLENVIFPVIYEFQFI